MRRSEVRHDGRDGRIVFFARIHIVLGQSQAWYRPLSTAHSFFTPEACRTLPIVNATYHCHHGLACGNAETDWVKVCCMRAFLFGIPPGCVFACHFSQSRCAGTGYNPTRRRRVERTLLQVRAVRRYSVVTTSKKRTFRRRFIMLQSLLGIVSRSCPTECPDAVQDRRERAFGRR